MYKTELHAHTSPVSQCAQSSPIQAVEDYIANGYRTLVITNHMSPPLFDMAKQAGLASWEQIARLYLSDYRAARAHAGQRLHVLLGMEIRLNQNMNDYLVYGVGESFVYGMGDVMGLALPALSALVHRHGGLIYQAHPFRTGMTVADPALLDGIETANCCRSHDSRNEIADAWADKFGLLKIGGSDYHRAEHMTGAGILTDRPITNERELVSVLRAMDFTMDRGTGV